MSRRQGEGIAISGPQWSSGAAPSGPSVGSLLGTKSGGGLFGSKFGMAPTEPVNLDSPANLPLDRVSLQPSAMTNGNALPAYTLPSWASDSGNDPTGMASKQTFLNVPEQMNPFSQLGLYGVLPGTNLTAQEMQDATNGKVIPQQIMSQLQIERMKAGGPQAGTSALDGQWLDQYWDRWNKASAPKAPVQEPAQAQIPDLVTMLQGARQPEFDLSRLYQGWQYQ